MSISEIAESGRLPDVDLRIEAVVIPASDVDRAKAVYGRLGWRLDADFEFDNAFRGVRFTTARPACSIQFGTKKAPRRHRPRRAPLGRPPN